MFQTNSNFNTPYNTIRELLYMIKLKDNSTILEPCAGEGNFVIELKQWNKTLTVDACEINSQFEFALKLSGADNIYIKNFFELPITKYDYVLSNPPFNQVERFLRKSYLHLKDDGQMIMLLQLSLLGGKKMNKLLNEIKPNLIHVLSERPKFPGKWPNIGGYGWVFFDKPCASDTIIKWEN